MPRPVPHDHRFGQHVKRPGESKTWWVLGLKYLFGYDETNVVRKELIIILKAHILPSLENRLASKLNEIKKGQATLQNESERIKALRRNLLQQIESAKQKENVSLDEQ